jgi:hypothetical protein
MLIWQKELWLIDHGAALYFHHSWSNWKEQALKPFAMIKDHVLLPQASKLTEVDAEFKAILTEDRIRAIVDWLPDEWLATDLQEAAVAERRQVYADFLITRIASSHIFVKEAQHAGKILI